MTTKGKNDMLKNTGYRSLIAALALAASSTWLHAGVHRFDVTINYAGESATNVPVLLRLSESTIANFHYADTANGKDFEIYDDTGALLPYEIDTWNPEGDSLLWVKVPVFENGKKLSVTYGRTRRDMTVNATNVWSGYVGVWHMNDATADRKYPNATGASMFDGVISSYSATNQTGQFGKSVKIYTQFGFHPGKTANSLYDANAQFEKGGVFIPDNGNMNLTSNFVMSGWFNHSTTNAQEATTSYAFRYDNVFYKRRHSDAVNSDLNSGMADRLSGFGIRMANGADVDTKTGYSGSSASTSISGYTRVTANFYELLQDGISPAITNGVWRHLSFVISYDSASAKCVFARRVDGVATSPVDAQTIKDNDEPLAIGNTTAAYTDGVGDAPGDRAWGGYADEVRLIIGAPSAAYLAAEYAGMAQADLLTFGEVREFNDRFTVTINYAGESATNVPMRLRLSTALIDGFSYAETANGTNFEIYDDQGALLPYEIDTWNPEGESLLWVKVPVFEGGKKLSVIYGRTKTDMTANATNVWSGYAGVWHMNETNAEGKYPNAAGASMFDGVVSSFSATGKAGKFGSSVLIYTNASHTGKGGEVGTERYEYEKGGVFIPDDGNMNLTTNFVMSGWFNHSTTAKTYPASGSIPKTTSNNFRWDNVFSKRRHCRPEHELNDDMADRESGFGSRIQTNANSADCIGFIGPNYLASPTNSPYFNTADYSTGDTEGEFRPRGISLANGAWHHFSFAVSPVIATDNKTHEDYPTCIVERRVDGVAAARAGDVGIIRDNDEPLAIGSTTGAYGADGNGDEYGDRTWGGYADEVRLIIGAPSAAYLAAEYAGMADDGLLTYGPPETPAGVKILFF